MKKVLKVSPLYIKTDASILVGAPGGICRPVSNSEWAGLELEVGGSNAKLIISLRSMVLITAEKLLAEAVFNKLEGVNSQGSDSQYD